MANGDWLIRVLYFIIDLLILFECSVDVTRVMFPMEYLEAPYLSSKLWPCFVVSSILIFLVLRSVIIVEIVGTAVHRESTTRQQFSWHDCRVRVTKVCHHARLPIQLIGPVRGQSVDLAEEDAHQNEKQQQCTGTDPARYSEIQQ